MRTFLLSIFWVAHIGSVFQLLIMVSAGLILYSGSYSFSELSVNVFITQFVPWLIWLKTFIISLLGEFGGWLLEMPILVIAPLKFIAGTVIGLWAYSLSKEMLVEPVST